MPEFIIEVTSTSKRIFGPFPSAAVARNAIVAARNAIVAGELRKVCRQPLDLCDCPECPICTLYDKLEVEDNSPVTFKIKEVKPEK
jgi:hypothetical protein